MGNMDKMKWQRNATIVEMYRRGMTQQAIADQMGINQSRVSAIIARVIRPTDPAEIEALRNDMIEKLNSLLEMHLERAQSPLPPAFTSKGEILRDEESNIVRDGSSSRLESAAAQTAMKRLCDMLGLDAPQRVKSDVTVNYTYEGVDTDGV